MAPAQEVCVFFQQGKCKKGANCEYAHVIAPSFKPKACQYYMKGTCRRGKNCLFSHNQDDIGHLKISNGATGIGASAPENSEARLRDFRWRIPKSLADAKPLGYALGRFFQQALELVDIEVGTMQEVITLLASEGGLQRVDELLALPFATFTPAQLTRVITTQLMPFFKTITHPNVTSSVLLRSRILTIYNILYTGDGDGQRAISLFTALAACPANSALLGAVPENGEPDVETLETFETTLAVLSNLVDVNTPAHADPRLIPITETFAALLDNLPESTTFAMGKAKKDLERLQQRLSIGQRIPDAQTVQRKAGVRAVFELARDLPGELSEEGPRHDNDKVHIENIRILPTLQEIQSSRNEYLPVADPREWHFGGVTGLVDRHFRLLREDTVGQLRDAAKFELERLQKPQDIEMSKPKRQGARTYVYNDVYVASTAFDELHGLQVAIRFSRPQANCQRSRAARQEWWNYSRRLGPDTLICLLSSEGSATFFVVAAQTHKPTRLQAEFDLASDPEHAYVVIKPVEQAEIHDILAQAVGDTAYAQLSIVEFPGVLLPSFEPTLKAMQRISKDLDIPFAHILAPTSTPENPDREISVLPPTYATKPGFKYNLASITTNKEVVEFATTDSIADAAEQLTRYSPLDPGQSLAVISALARSLALIQGPPGTGKSYTGVQLIRVLLANKAATGIGPIVICTHTNHALDAILERLMDNGVSRIVRIGGRSKSERLEDVNLRVLAQRLDLTKTEKSERWKLIQHIKNETEEINRVLGAFTSIRSHIAVKNHLRLNHPTYYSQIYSSDGEGWTTVGYKRDTDLDVWLRTGHPGSGRQRSMDDPRNDNLLAMTFAERGVIFNSWLLEMRDELRERLCYAFSSYNESKQKLDVIRSEVNLRVLRQANVIGITTSGLARNLDLLHGVKSKVLVCEEAGEILEAHLLTTLLPSLDHTILIGDHQQLRPQVQNFDLSTESHTGGQYALNISLFERLVSPQDLFAQSLPFSTLEVQRRMRPSVSQLVRQTQYPSLQDDPSVALYPNVVGMRRNLFWMHHDKLEDDIGGVHFTSRTNTYEVDMVASLVKHLAAQGAYKPADTAVITPYLGQLRKLKAKFSSTHTILMNDRDVSDLENEDLSLDERGLEQSVPDPNRPVKGSLNQALRLATVDNFQGEEAKVVIVSLVRSNKEKKPGFLKTPNRINVLLSRAQHGMYIFGNTNTTASVPMWQDVIDILRSNGSIGEALELSCPRHPDTPIVVQKPADFTHFSPEAGCDLACEKQLKCGHACVAKCHSDMLHNAVYCMKPCTKLKNGCTHRCEKPCGDQCDPFCTFPIDDIAITLDCGHKKTTMLCYEAQKPGTIRCEEPVERKIPGCGHDVAIACHIDVGHNGFHCSAACGKLLACGHTCRRPCWRCNTRTDGCITKTDHGKCTQPCDRGYTTCQHRCMAPCHNGNPCSLCKAKCDSRCSHGVCAKLCHESCTPCSEEQCDSGWQCSHSARGCTMPCAAPCIHLPCSERCEKTLPCGCRCPSICGEPCPEMKFCQVHGSDDVKSMQADLLTFNSYRDIDLDTDPCIFTPCGHIFTIDSLDGTMGMQTYYEIDPRTGKYVGLKHSPEPLSIQDSRPCPDCRGSLRNVARYGRVVRRAALDESAKKLTAWSNRKHQELATRLSDIEGELMGSLDFPRKPTQPIKLAGPVNAQLERARKLKTAKRYRKLLALIDEIALFSQKLSKDEQPYQRVHDLVEIARCKSTEYHKSLVSGHGDEELQLREHLQAGNLMMRAYVVLFGDIITVQEKTPTGIRGIVHVDFAAVRTLCGELIAEAKASLTIRQEAEAQVLWAKFAAIERGVLGSVPEADVSGIQHRVDELNTHAIERLKTAEDICARQTKLINDHNERLRRERPDLLSEAQKTWTDHIAEEACEVRRMLKERLTSTEMRMVVNVMAKEFGGTGHWYRCANGHPFTVGECGMPMQLARCPECGAEVGGRNHQSTEGVTQARDLDDMLGSLAI